jgi:hypothetical protein
MGTWTGVSYRDGWGRASKNWKTTWQKLSGRGYLALSGIFTSKKVASVVREV